MSFTLSRPGRSGEGLSAITFDVRSPVRLRLSLDGEPWEEPSIRVDILPPGEDTDGDPPITLPPSRG